MIPLIVCLFVALLCVCVSLCFWNVLCQAKEQLNIVYADTVSNQALLRACPSLSTRPYSPASGWGKFGFFQTVYAFVGRSAPRKPHWTRVDIRNERDVTISLDIIEPMSNEKDNKKEKERISDVTPSAVVIVFPGITGGSHNQYIRCIGGFCADRGWHTILFNWPGSGTSSVTSPRFFPIGESTDLDLVIKFAQQRWPSCPLFALGFSLGANALTTYLGRNPNNPLRAAAAFCLAFDMHAAFSRIDTKPIYRAAMLMKGKQLIKDNEAKLREMGEVDVDALLACSSLREWDELFTVKIFKISVDDLYRNESSMLQLPHVRTPLLIVNALDDPLFPESIFPPADVFRANPQLIFACTRYGGHTAWAEGCTPWPNDFTYMDRVAIDWISAHLRLPRHAAELNV